MLAFSLFAAALATECPERLTQEQLDARVQALEPDVFYVEEGTPEALAALEGLLDGCAEGPIAPTSLARLWILMGVSEHFFAGEIGPEGQLRLGSAMALGGREAWPEAYGEALQSEYLASSAVAMGGATLALHFSDYDIVSVDGEIRYARGDWSTTPGLHLVQWRLEAQGPWHSALVRLERGGRVELGATPPAPVEEEGAPPTQRERAPREPRERSPSGARTLSVQAALGYSVSGGQLEDTQGYPAAGVESLPVGSLRAQLSGERLWGGLDLFGAPQTEGPGWPSAAAALGGARLELGEATLALGAGPVLTSAPRLVALQLPDFVLEDWTPNPPSFTRSTAAGARALAQLSLSERRLTPSARLSVDLASGGLVVARLEPSLALPVQSLSLNLGLPLSLLITEQGRLLQAAGAVGVTWSR